MREEGVGERGKEVGEGGREGEEERQGRRN